MKDYIQNPCAYYLKNRNFQYLSFAHFSHGTQILSQKGEKGSFHASWDSETGLVFTALVKYRQNHSTDSLLNFFNPF